MNGVSCLFTYIPKHMVYLLLYNLQILRANPISETTLQSSSGRVEIPKNVHINQTTCNHWEIGLF